MASVIKIGRTNYFTVRKGTQQYCIAEGRRLQDAEYCWQVMNDEASGRTYFINGVNVRRWHLPDLHMTEKEKDEELRDIRARREHRKQEAERLARIEAGEDDDAAGGGGAAANLPPPDEDAEARFGARDRAALNATLLAGWENPLLRQAVSRVVKAAIQSHYAHGVLTDEDFTKLVLTVTREHCSTLPPPLTKEQEVQLRDIAIAAVQERVEDERRRKEYERLINELRDKIRRLETERRRLQNKVDSLTASEESMRDELFALRAHKQDTLLAGFKRLTRVGLVESYWQRWVRYKSVLEAQLHVRARERRKHELMERVVELEAKLHAMEEENKKLHNSVIQQTQRNVVKVMQNAFGADVMRHFFHIWKRFGQMAAKEREYFRVKEMLLDCPACKLRGIETERLYGRLQAAIDKSVQAQDQLVAAQEEIARRALQTAETTELLQLRDMAVEASRHEAQLRSKEAAGLRKDVAKLQDKLQSLSKHVDALKFESRQNATRPFDDVHGGQVRVLRPSSDDLNSSSHEGDGGVARAGGLPTGLGASKYFEREAAQAAATSLQRLKNQPYAGPPVTHPPAVGHVHPLTEAALAPDVMQARPARTSTVQSTSDPLKLSRNALNNPPSLSSKGLGGLAQRSRATDLPPKFSSSSSDSTTSSSSSSSSSDSSSSSSSSGSPPPSEDSSRASSPISRPTQQRTTTTGDEDDDSCNRCHVCRMKLQFAAFCPVDGHRHAFFQPPGVVESRNELAKSFSASFVAAAGTNHGTSHIDANKFLHLPPGRGSGNPPSSSLWGAPGQGNGTFQGSFGSPPPPPPLSGSAAAPPPPPSHVLPHTAALRASLSLDARTFRPILQQSMFGVDIKEPVPNPTDPRESADLIRDTKLTTALGRAGAISKPLVETNLHSSDRPALSLHSRLLSSPPKESTTKRNQYLPNQVQVDGRWGSIFEHNFGDDVLGQGTVVKDSDRVFGVYRRGER